MGEPNTTISAFELSQLVGTPSCPLVFDVRRETVYAEAEDIIPTAMWRNHRRADIWAKDLAGNSDVVVYCVHGHQVSQSAATLLRARGVRAKFLEGGIESYRELNGPLIVKSGLPNRSENQASRWITGSQAGIGGIACPWFIRRFVDRDAAICFLSSDQVADAAVELDAVAFEVPDVRFTGQGELCSFDAFLSGFGLTGPALEKLAVIVRGASTARFDMAPQAAGLLALLLGLSAMEGDDHKRLEKGMVVFDALYGWCRVVVGETEGGWPAGTVSIVQGPGR